jgi:hypothetical protein
MSGDWSPEGTDPPAVMRVTHRVDHLGYADGTVGVAVTVLQAT